MKVTVRLSRRRPQRGMALLGIMVILFFILGIILLGTLGRTSAMSANADASLQQIALQADSQTAHNLAETGVRITYSWMLEQDSINGVNLPFAPSEVGSDFYGASLERGYNVIRLSQAPTTGESASGQAKPSLLRVRIYPGNDPTTGQKVFAIQCVGECGTSTYSSRLVVRPKGFAEYGIFYDEPLDGFVWMAGMHIFTGPVHLNMRLPGTNTVAPAAKHTIVWGTTNLIFTHPDTNYFTCAGAPSQIVWMKGLVTKQEPALGDWQFVATSGTAPKFNAPLIPFPTNTSTLQKDALGGATAPATPGLLVPSAGSATVGGIFVEGSVTQLTLSTSGIDNVNQVLTFYQTSGTTALRTVVTLNHLTNQTLVERYATPKSKTESLTATESYTGVTNGLVYVNGDIGDQTTQTGGLAGAVANNVSADSVTRITIATPENRRTQINGGIIYQRLASGNASNLQSSATEADPLCGVFGLITGRMWIVENDQSKIHIDNITLHAALFAIDASGGNPSVGCTNYTTRKGGIYRHLGALIIKKDGPFGQFTYNSTTGELLDQFGFNRKRVYDFRLTELAPAFFPLAGRTYKVVSYQSGVTALP